jgi:lauroyl/myristoyl acyltransferase
MKVSGPRRIAAWVLLILLLLVAGVVLPRSSSHPAAHLAGDVAVPQEGRRAHWARQVRAWFRLN